MPSHDQPGPHNHVEIDSDVDLRIPDERDELRRALPLLGVIALGGMLGAVGRFAISEAWATPRDAFPWAMFTINTTGCFALGIVMAYVVSRAERLHPLIRPLLGTGLLGGYTSFSTYAVDANHLLIAHHPGLALAYLATSAVVGLAAVLLGRAAATRASRVVSASIGRRA